MKSYLVYDNNYEHDLEVIIGETAQENWNIINDSDQHHLWFHLNNLPSPHVILKLPNNKQPHKQTILYCGKLCKDNSNYNNAHNVNVIYTTIKNVSKGDKVGSVTTKNVLKFKI